MHAGTSLNSVKANFDIAYSASTPIPYMVAMNSVEYQIPQNARPVFEKLIWHLERDRGRPINILDLGASYGVNAALLKYRVEMRDIYNHYLGNAALAEYSDQLLAADHQFFGGLRRRSASNIIGLDASANAISYALRSGVLDSGLAVDLESEDTRLCGRIFDVDLIISTGTIGYVGPRTILRVMDLCRRPDEVWLACFVLQLVDFRPVEAALSARGMKTEALRQMFIQRNFSDQDERSRAMIYAVDNGLEYGGDLSEHHLLSQFFLSRPQRDAAAPLEGLLETAEEAKRLSA